MCPKSKPHIENYYQRPIRLFRLRRLYNSAICGINHLSTGEKKNCGVICVCMYILIYERIFPVISTSVLFFPWRKRSVASTAHTSQTLIFRDERRQSPDNFLIRTYLLLPSFSRLRIYFVSEGEVKANER